MPAKKYYKINLDTEILLSLLRNKTKDKPSKTKKTAAAVIPEIFQSRKHRIKPKKSMVNQASTKCRNKLRQNRKPWFSKMSKQALTKC
jgi:hypothetical protein